MFSPPERSFLDWTVATDPSTVRADVALFGVPLSEAYSGDPRPNDQARAPEAIRAQSQRFCYDSGNWDFDLGFDFASALPERCIDLGNIALADGDYDRYAAGVTAVARRLWSAGTQIVVLGGDHGVTIPVLAALDAVGEPVHVLQIDAHIDWRDEVRGARRGYSSPMRRASENPAVAGITQVGMRGVGSARRGEVEAARAWGACLVPAEAVHASGVEPVLATIPERRAVYVTIDADGLDPSEMPGVMAPTPGGLRFAQVAPLVRAVATRHRIVGMDLVEVAPGFDAANGMTAIAAGRLVLNVLGASWGEGGGSRVGR